MGDISMVYNLLDIEEFEGASLADLWFLTIPDF